MAAPCPPPGAGGHTRGNQEGSTCGAGRGVVFPSGRRRRGALAAWQSREFKLPAAGFVGKTLTVFILEKREAKRDSPHCARPPRHLKSLGTLGPSFPGAQRLSCFGWRLQGGEGKALKKERRV